MAHPLTCNFFLNQKLRLDSLSDTQDQLATTVNPADDLVFEDYIVPKDTGKKKMIYGKKT